MGKLGCNVGAYEGQDWSINLLKDFVYDIDDKVQQMSLQQRTGGFETYRTSSAH